MSSTAHQDADKPERSRNAKAQARHRAKRKAYIEELEETVTKLQTALGQFTFEQAAVMPPPLAKIRELEQENARLLKENDELHRLLGDGGRRAPMPFESAPRRNCDDVPEREYKRRKMDNGTGDEGYLPPQSRPSSSHDIIARPPPLTVPDSPLPHPHAHAHHGHYHESVSVTPLSAHGPGPSFGLDPGLHIPGPDADPARPYDREHDLATGAPHYTLPPFKFATQALPEHDSWRPYSESERGP
ncbi:hypothetical protein C8R47DRAFT_1090505 [Mycena vitilis]|nr:hypothetical protein C8R47DRAFT_1090505 [Mycena vitilis]